MSTRPAARDQARTHVRPRDAILDIGLALLRRGEAVSLDAVARAVGLTKPGVMYHFPTKEALMTALIDHMLDSYEDALTAVLSHPPRTAAERIGAYVRWAFTAPHDRADLVMLGDPKLHDELVSHWSRRFGPWVEVPAEVEPDQRARLLAARLIADGHWFAEASAGLTLTPDERERVQAVALDLIGDRQ